ncbi:two-component system phosphate regulon sensor histidine kinase PhoR [Desulfobotulus alkaliphilus]|uniref:histidine kinase n=1 Tax=Desulfobotulus alkaliphilus TaxID=622671 RepID=A0A562RTM6_9BACT|nr:ATP-binding protein [Desulfobotulus alkaliphilus]TWI71656.1 two-component system phosphate regulon sensor histidine kinase PhoR [Desulfobotulus alkaliphilus]
MIKKRALLWQLYPSYFLIILVGLVAVSLYSAGTMKQFFMENTQKELVSRALILKPKILSLIKEGNYKEVQRICKETGAASETRFTVVLPSGLVVGDTDENPMDMENHRDRVEIVRAASGLTGVVSRYSETVSQSMMYVAIPLESSGNLKAVLRAAVPLTAVDEAVLVLQKRIFICGFLVLVLAAGFSWFLSRKIANPLIALREGANRFASGDLSHRLFVPDIQEMAALSDAMNRMAEDLDQRIRLVVRQRNELEAVLSSMEEGVIALDTEGALLRMNQAAARMFGVDAAAYQGRNVHEVVRNLEALRFVDKALAAESSVEADMDLYQYGKKLVHAHSSPLKDADDQRMGTLFVIQDVTQLRRLEHMRKDFVANVSHELKTPLTAIKGFVETLREDGSTDPEEAKRFMHIIDRNVNRLILLVDDLLKLSAIEQEAENEDLLLEEKSLKDVLSAAVQLCTPRMEEKGIEGGGDCPESLKARMDSHLMEHAFVNLLDNALKYSSDQARVHIHAEEKDAFISIAFADSGPGIPEEHLPRLFERFYRVDKARTRRLGGTGLGLAIVKHIMNAHGGRVEVRSRPGEGSVFTLFLPL